MRVVPLAVAAAAAALLSGCAGGDDRQSASDWASSFCSASGTWGTELERIVDGVDLYSLTPRLEDAVADAGEVTGSYVSELRSLGSPDMGSSDDVEAAIEDLANELEGETAEIEDAFDDASGVSGPATVGREVAHSVAAMFTSFERTLDSLAGEAGGDELDAALAEAEACDRLRRP